MSPPARPGVEAEQLDLSFEAALERLEEIAASLEREELELTESLALFEEGVRLLRLAEERLGGAETRVHQLLEEGEGFRMQPLAEEP